MSKKVTLRKRCGNPNCQNSNCDYVVVEKQRTFSNYRKKFQKATGLNGFTIFGASLGFGITTFMVILLALALIEKWIQSGGVI